MLLHVFIQLSYTKPIYFSDDNIPVQTDGTFLENYAFVNEPFKNEILLDDVYYPEKRTHDDTIHVIKRVIMLPRVGRR